ncbi:hypothetical protein NEOLEDRAFT_1110477 [Neolentinus lepideus HHB14362 ss-1]|uniref:25S rRNA (uridine-N(3))-methyltransferase BMT5-like domain-containing protein n=1 Tax=Neolentinus lepideus HHB14362 ss-1 TaxID=1314782 RepID=A0A165U595_9AGAM|nr:hypothetical protein NEOLEDRAFT_1110477 [Neolentinus lepideus HHB14362 ss-1]
MGKSGNKSSLKAALLSHQARVDKKERAARAAKAADHKGKSGSSQTKGKEKIGQRPSATIPFSPEDTILLIGEGNFSFAHALVASPPPALEFLPAKNVTATAYDSEEHCYEKYPECREIIATLRDKGVELLFGVDATKLEKCATLKGRRFDRIVWNFPHAGKGIADQDRNILSNQLLILEFLRSASNSLIEGPVPSVHQSRKRKRKSDEDDDDEEQNEVSLDERLSGEGKTRSRGTILITLRNVPPYTLWDVPKLAKNPPPPTGTGTKPNPKYMQLRSFKFVRSSWKGYAHRMTKGERQGGQGTTGQGGEDRTWEFCLRDKD